MTTLTETIDPDNDASTASEENAEHRFFADVLKKAQSLGPLPTAVVYPLSDVALLGAVEAAQIGLLQPVLIGPTTAIQTKADTLGLDLGGCTFHDIENDVAAAQQATKLAREGQVKALMKGSLHTDHFMGAIVSRQEGLRTERRLSHVYVMDVPTYPKPLFISDAAINIYPDLMVKRDIVQNAIDLAIACGTPNPKVAILSAFETVKSKLPSTLEAAALCKMADRGQITGGELDGPLAFDNAISVDAARTKGIVSNVAGNADILIAPDLEAGNILAKQLSFLANAKAAGIVLGARVPVILTSRADTKATRLASCALACLLNAYQQQQLDGDHV
ncbi:MAG: phosphate acetyltransferase [Kordiimonas sp.]|mgnify:CR=1 FL=1|nr:phosphate acetyltransferase [Kordiimonas sp.]|tara:strand:+ start:3718 stop:4716 length:999 start_codon:yes stop_codon:yes gene_type:complete